MEPQDPARDAFISKLRGKLQRLFDAMDTDGSGFLQGKSHARDEGADMCPICLEAVDPQACMEVWVSGM